LHHMASQRHRSGKIGPKKTHPGLPGPKTMDLVDIFIFLLDSRIPETSLDLAEPYLRKERRVYVMTKPDLADVEITAKWVEYFRDAGMPCFLVEAHTGKGLSSLIEYLNKNKQEIQKKSSGKFLSRPLRIMLFGLPNVGKSSLANRLLGTSKAPFGAKPGLTRGSRWLRADDSVEILDTPGVIDTSQVKDDVLYKLAATWAVPEKQYDAEEAAFWLSKEVFDPEYPGKLISDFGLSRGMLGPGGIVDIDRASRAFIHEFRTGNLGRFSLETPPNA